MPTYNATTGVDTLIADGQDDIFNFYLFVNPDTAEETHTVQAGDYFDGAGGADVMVLAIAPDSLGVAWWASFDFRAATVLGFETLQFDSSFPGDAFQAIFAHTQLSASLSVIGDSASYDSINVHLTPDASFSAAGWSFTSWDPTQDGVVIVGAGGSETIVGSLGSDTLDGGAGVDAMFGGDGDDTYIVDNAGDVTSEASALGGIDWVHSSMTYNLTANIENLILTGGEAIIGYGNVVGNVIIGNGAANTLYGFDGNDILDGNTGADQMFGGNGNDVYVVDNAGDVTSEASALGGTDTVLSVVTRNLNANIENLTLQGGSAINGYGNALDNTIIGNDGPNSLHGFDGNDILDGGGGADGDADTGADTLFGGNGDDTYIVRDAADITVEGSALGGVDTVESWVSRNLNANFENMILMGTAATAYGNILGNSITGNDLANSLYGFDGNDTLDGGAGNDAMFGGNGDDSYYVDSAGDVTSESSALGGTDTVFSSVTRNLNANIENLTLTGAADITGAGNVLDNTLIGNAGANTLYGLAGADRLDGGLGADVLQGGVDADTYVFSSALGGGNVDQINGFNVAEDAIELDAAIFTALSAGPLDAGAFNTGAAATEADDRIIYDPTTGALYYDADGAGGAAQIQFATLTAGLALTSDHFIVGGG